MEVILVKKILPIFLIITLIFAACGGESTVPAPTPLPAPLAETVELVPQATAPQAATPVPVATTVNTEVPPKGEVISFNEGDCLSYDIYFETSLISLFICLDGAGPNGASIRGIAGHLQVGGKILRQVGNQMWEIGEIIEIGTYTARIMIYDKAVIYSST
ncbi:hypothetical protein COV58_01145 [Candidatus Roizmanbacteria bacterium CG11_big_fil_rev_8_21_14_0_20_36_8]|uniref:Uncharacterized protein n=1 Tax=Candidatus Roizmanbacteria bacterium CG11_big_fil_rev_8_21_14_0_20_36_8 TaxID=1974856 RepID=A0A2M6IUW7_9BACT|nr:MAG: hypothetical protein COV58_01145 [Candidatus Roizmanbacteria bacterium CG11_big_fil_rev_8_21_14_0_20_36_8]